VLMDLEKVCSCFNNGDVADLSSILTRRSSPGQASSSAAAARHRSAARTT